MKPLAFLLLPLVNLILASPTDLTRCGALGVLRVNASSLPLGVSLQDVRTCAEHPLRVSPAGPDLQRRSCWYGAKWGCTGGYCWKACDASESGKWCWTSAPRGQGLGPWMRCTLNEQCNEDLPCGLGEHCSSCGCSC
ncbi:hypothetical protein CDD82_6700 [Ophiocordyceps australis]|uniref:IDI-2 n=1 Tax=Ophiocordyceps australis TaxID=1399860 RepID=A0A2C5ZQX0_9HYPO|nr:hypothetical protein CDD82_6700 [Ophiocordyceps australis]